METKSFIKAHCRQTVYQKYAFKKYVQNKLTISGLYRQQKQSVRNFQWKVQQHVIHVYLHVRSTCIVTDYPRSEEMMATPLSQKLWSLPDPSPSVSKSNVNNRWERVAFKYTGRVTIPAVAVLASVLKITFSFIKEEKLSTMHFSNFHKSHIAN